MSSDADNNFFAPPAFKPAEALVLLKRQLRDLKPLAERGGGFELKGQPVVALEADERKIAARLVKRRATTPEWETHALGSSAEVRKFVDEVKKRLARWIDDDQ